MKLHPALATLPTWMKLRLAAALRFKSKRERRLARALALSAVADLDTLGR